MGVNHRVATMLGSLDLQWTVRFAGIDIYRVTNGMLSEHWNVVDRLEFYRQGG